MFEDIDNLQFEQLVKSDQQSVILDVRTPAEWEEGIIPNAVTINMMSPDFSGLVNELEKKKHYYVYCRSGARSKSACQMMSVLGFEKLYNLKGGIQKWHGDLIT